MEKKTDTIGCRLKVGDIIAWPASGYGAGSKLVVGTVRRIEPGERFNYVHAETLKGREVDVTYKDVALIGNEATTRIVASK
jgi:hypothetical protein